MLTLYSDFSMLLQRFSGFFGKWLLPSCRLESSLMDSPYIGYRFFDSLPAALHSRSCISRCSGTIHSCLATSWLFHFFKLFSVLSFARGEKTHVNMRAQTTQLASGLVEHTFWAQENSEESVDVSKQTTLSARRIIIQNELILHVAFASPTCRD